MEYVLGVIILALIGTIIYRDRLFSATIKDLTLKVMAKSVSDYTFLMNREAEASSPVIQEETTVSDDMMEFNDPNLSDEDLLAALKK